jgi:hypothetical protein
VRDEMGNELLARVGTVVGPLPPGMPPWTYLQTVLAERSRRETERLTRGVETSTAMEPPTTSSPQRPSAVPPAGPFAPPS